jgi:predicted transglutaminase-like cysteine proteinase
MDANTQAAVAPVLDKMYAGHIVLWLWTPQGIYAMDSLRPVVYPWRKAEYASWAVEIPGVTDHWQKVTE